MTTNLSAVAIDVNQTNMALGNEVFEAEGATFIRSREAHDSYDANHIAHVCASTPAEIDALLQRLEKEYSHARHRRVHTDFRTPPEFIARLSLEGYTRDDALVLLLEGDLRTSPKAFEIRPVTTEPDWEAHRQLFLLDWTQDQERHGHKIEPATRERTFGRRQAKQPRVQYFLAYVDGRAVAYFNSWGGTDGVGQVEDLFTHPDFRHRGIATALIHHCVADARTKGAGPLVIVADPTNTPKNMYAAMGFRPVAVTSSYLKRLDPLAGC